MKRLLLALAAAVSLTSLTSQPALAAPPPPSQINLDIGTPPVIAVRHSLAQRQSRLIRFFDAGIMGLDINGMVKVRDQERLSRQHLSVQQAAGKTIDQENPDRMSLIYAIAEAHGGKEAIPVVKEMMAKRWREQFKSGWWMEDEQGNWIKKP
ncbi:MAG TPA: DUF1318 domain-containing protein [Azospira sp.]|nr:DUF1318 domain-containing protein [Azospira sp.]